MKQKKKWEKDNLTERYFKQFAGADILLFYKLGANSSALQKKYISMYKILHS
jgi:hypothetical protein